MDELAATTTILMGTRCAEARRERQGRRVILGSISEVVGEAAHTPIAANTRVRPAMNTMIKDPGVQSIARRSCVRAVA